MSITLHIVSKSGQARKIYPVCLRHFSTGCPQERELLTSNHACVTRYARLTRNRNRDRTETLRPGLSDELFRPMNIGKSDLDIALMQRHTEL